MTTRRVNQMAAAVLGATCLAWSATIALAAHDPPRLTGGEATPTRQDESKNPSARVGKPAPEFSLSGVDGQTYSLTEFKGHIVVLEWCNPRCPVSKDLFERGLPQKARADAIEVDDGVIWLAINSTGDTTDRENALWIRKHRLDYPILLDGDGAVAHRYDARTTPHMFVIDKEGMLVYAGAFDDDANGVKAKKGEAVTNYVVNAIESLVSDKRVRPATTKPYGCNIKFKDAAAGEEGG